MSNIEYFFGLSIIGAFIYALSKSYWLRMLSAGMLLVFWGLVAFIAPLYFAYDAFQDGAIFRAIATLAVSVVIFIPWAMAMRAARNWTATEKRLGRWTAMPWSAR